MKNKQNNSADTFYGKKDIALLITAAVIIAIVGIVGMYSIGIIKMPSFLEDMLEKPEDNTAVPVAGNLKPEDEEKVYFEALPRDEYATALADIAIPEKYYQRYSVTLYAGEVSNTTDYIAIRDGESWWVQTSKDDVILSTVISKDGKVKISDNTDNTSIVDTSDEIDFFEYFGYTPLDSLTGMIKALANGESIDYAGGVSDFSLSFTQARGTGENIFIFNLTRSDGFKEEYTFAFESATILSATKYLPSGEKIYQMEMHDSQSDTSGIDVDSLFVID